MNGEYFSSSCELKTPSDLRSFLGVLRSAVDNGGLVQVWPDKTPFATQENISYLEQQLQWPDYFKIYFRSSKTGEIFALDAETYHGVGGTWSRVD